MVEGYDFLQRQIANCDERLQQYMAVLPARAMESEEVVEEPAKGSQQPRKSKPRSKNQPRFDLGSELHRVFGVDLTRIDGINVMTAQVILAELGPDLSAFPGEGQFALHRASRGGERRVCR